MGIGTIADAHQIIVFFNGRLLSACLQRALEGGVSHMCPVSAFQHHPSATFVCDEASTLDLQVKTVQYFRGLLTQNQIVKLQGREYVLFSGLLRTAHDNGLTSIDTEIISWEPDARAAVVRAVVEGSRGRYSAHGDASPANVGKNIASGTKFFAIVFTLSGSDSST